MAQTKITIEKLAEMINEGFKSTASKEDIQRVESRLDNLDARVGRIEADIHALRDEVVYRHEFDDALDRLKYLEKTLGIDSGV
jgi:hypothetical protein